MMILYIKNMVCVRCKMAVRSALDKLGIAYLSIELGRVELRHTLTAAQYKEVQAALAPYQLELIHDRKAILAERIKNLITEIVYADGTTAQLKFTITISQALQYDYTYLSNIFTEVEGSTIEKFYILTRIQRVKELMVYDNRNLKEITHLLNYSSVSHLCNQFKKVTGQRPSDFKKLYQAAMPTSC